MEPEGGQDEFGLMRNSGIESTPLPVNQARQGTKARKRVRKRQSPSVEPTAAPTWSQLVRTKPGRSTLTSHTDPPNSFNDDDGTYIEVDGRPIAMNKLRQAFRESTWDGRGERHAFRIARNILEKDTGLIDALRPLMRQEFDCKIHNLWKHFEYRSLADMPWLAEQVALVLLVSWMSEKRFDKVTQALKALYKLYNQRMVHKESEGVAAMNACVEFLASGTDPTRILDLVRQHFKTTRTNFRMAGASDRKTGGQSYCRSYNMRGNCRYQSCKFKHACFACGRPGHGLKECFKMKPRQGGERGDNRGAGKPRGGGAQERQ